jgi:ADP-Ribosyltransferase in polyvalent proteins
MTDSLSPLFADRTMRLSVLPDEQRLAFETLEKNSGDPAFADRQFSALWMSKRTGLPQEEVLKNFDGLAARYFGEGTTPSQAYDRIAATYKPQSGSGQGEGGENAPEAKKSALMAGGTVIAKDVAGSLAGGASRMGYDTLGGFYANLASATGVTMKRPQDDPEYQALARSVALQDDPLAFSRVYDEPSGFGGIPDDVLIAQDREKMRAISDRVQAENMAALEAAKGTFSQGYSENARKIATTMYDLSRESLDAYGVRSEFQDSTVGQFVATAGSLPVTALYASLGPALGAGGIYASIYGQVEQERMAAEGAGYDPQAAFLGNVASAGPQAALEFAFGMERIMGKIITMSPKVGGRIAFGDAARLMGKTGLIAGTEEALTEPAQGFWNDWVASLTYDEKRELMTEDVLKQRIVESASAFALGFMFGGAVQGVKVADRNRGVTKAERFLTTRDGQLFEAPDFAALRASKTDAELRAMAGDPSMADTLVAAANGNVEAQAAYRQETLAKAFVDTDGLAAQGFTIGKVGELVAVRDGAGRITTIDPADPVAGAFLRELQGEAIAQKEATDATVAQAKSRFGETLEIESAVESPTLREMVDAGTITMEEAEDALATAKAINGLAEATTLETARPQGQARARTDASGIVRMVVQIVQGKEPTLVIEEVAEAWKHKAVKDGNLDPAELTAARKKWHADNGETDPTEGGKVSADRADTEWFSKRVIDYALANRKTELPDGWSKWLRAIGDRLREVLKGATKMRKLMRDGKLDPKLEGWFQAALGTSPAQISAQAFKQLTPAEKTEAARDALRQSSAGLVMLNEDLRFEMQSWIDAANRNEEAAPVMSELDEEMAAEAMKSDTFPKIEGNEESGWTVSTPEGERIGTARTLEDAQDKAMGWWYAQEQQAEREAAQAGPGRNPSDELQRVVIANGGLLAASRSAWSGELKAIAENMDTGKRLRFFRKNALGLDALREAVNDEGFTFETVNDLLVALDESTRGKPVYAQGGAAATFSLSDSRAKPADASNVTVLPDGARMVGPTTFSITAFHGTPHKVDKFRMDKIGTGEGAQAYGWGLYFAGKKAVADQYRIDISADYMRLGDGTLFDPYEVGHLNVRGELRKNGLDAAIKKAAEISVSDSPAADIAKADLDVLRSLESRGGVTEHEGNLYTVDLLPDEADFLDWDKPLADQSDKVLAALRATDWYQYAEDQLEGRSSSNNPAGANLYAWMTEENTDEEASKMLAAAGIPGIRYFDGLSRDENRGTRNFVLFDESLVKIIAENGKPVGGGETTFSLADSKAQQKAPGQEGQGLNVNADANTYRFQSAPSVEGDVVRLPTFSLVSQEKLSEARERVQTARRVVMAATDAKYKAQKEWGDVHGRVVEARTIPYEPEIKVKDEGDRKVRIYQGRYLNQITISLADRVIQNGVVLFDRGGFDFAPFPQFEPLEQANAELIDAEAALFLTEEEDGGRIDRFHFMERADYWSRKTRAAEFAALLDARDEDARMKSRTFVARVWEAFANHDEVFQYGRTDSADAEEVAKAVSSPGRPVTVRATDESVEFAGKEGRLTIYDADTDKPYIRATEAKSQGKQSGGGSQLYAAALDWIHNNGKRIKDDAGLTDINAIRRTSNFFASAIRWGTTKHLKPHADQGLKWTKNDALNVSALAAKEMDNAFKAVADAKEWVYGFSDAQFRDSKGGTVTREEFETAVRLGNPGKSGIGISTLQRAVITHSAIEAFARGETEADVLGAPNRGVVPAGVTYSLTQTETPAFRAWFGNSKVVDAQGNPLVVYHGTTANIATFSDDAKRRTDDGVFGRGFYFGDKDTANQYSAFPEYDARKPEGGSVMPVFLSIQNPASPEDVKRVRQELSWYDTDFSKKTRDALIREGFDGVIAPSEVYSTEYVAFYPEQIKSATGNRGTFDPANPDITFSLEDVTYAITGIPQNKQQQLQRTFNQIHARQAALFPYPYQQLAALPVQAKVSLGGHEAGLAGRVLLPVSERLRFIADKAGTRIGILTRVRRYYSEKGTNLRRYSDQVTPLMRGIARMNTDDVRIFGVAASNQDALARNAVLAKYGLQNEWASYEAARDALRNEMIAAGMEVGDIGEYFPRWVRDVTGLRESMGINASDGVLEQAVIEAEKSAGRPLRDEEVNAIIDGAVRGVSYGSKGSSAPSNTKQRKIVVIMPNQWQFYADPNDALSHWLNQSTEAIARYRFFGKAAQQLTPQQVLNPTASDLDVSIGTILAEEIAAGNLPATAQAEVKAMLDGLFSYHGRTNAWIRGFMDLSYWATMGKLSSALAQATDLMVSVYEAGPWNTFTAIPEAMWRNAKALPGVGNSKTFSEAVANFTKGKDWLTREELGIDRIMEEFNDQRFTTRALNQVFTATGLNFMDGLGKDVLLNAKFRQLTKQAVKGQLSASNQRMIDGIFGKAKAAQVIADFRANRKNADTTFAVYNVLADWQPISLAEYPEAYAKNPNARVLYMLKSYSIKMLAAYRREGLMKMWWGSPKQKIEGARNLSYLLALLFMAGASKDWLVDFMLDRDPQMEDVMVDNIFKLMQVSRYALWQQRNRATDEGIYGGVEAAAQIAGNIKQIGVDLIAPPFTLIERPMKDVKAWAKAASDYEPWSFYESESIQFIPVAGEFLYWTGPTGQGKIERRRALREKE